MIGKCVLVNYLNHIKTPFRKKLGNLVALSDWQAGSNQRADNDAV